MNKMLKNFSPNKLKRECLHYFLAGVPAYLFALIIGSQAERHIELIQLISVLPKRKNAQKLLSVFTVGIVIIRKWPSIKLPLRFAPEAL